MDPISVQFAKPHLFAYLLFYLLSNTQISFLYTYFSYPPRHAFCQEYELVGESNYICARTSLYVHVCMYFCILFLTYVLSHVRLRGKCCRTLL